MSNSNLETQFLNLWQLFYPEIELNREQRLIPNRRFLFDFVHIPSRVAIEINGGNWVRGRHTRPAQLNKEYEKYNLAQAQDYLVFTLSSSMIDKYWLSLIYTTIRERVNSLSRGGVMVLSLEQQLTLRLFANDIQKLSEAELKELLIKMFEESMLQHNLHKELLAKQWGID